VPLESASSVGFIFSTVSAPAAYSDGQGNSGAFSYPYTRGPVPVRAGPSGDVLLTLTFWRPQRQRIEDYQLWLFSHNLATETLAGAEHNRIGPGRVDASENNKQQEETE